MYKAIFLDLDGTTVIPFTDAPSDRVKKCVREAGDKIYVCLATGRLIHQCKKVIDALGISGYCIVANGIQIYNPKKKQIIKEIGLLPTDIPRIIQKLKRYNIEFHIFDGKEDIIYEPQLISKTLSLFHPALPHITVDNIIDDLSGFTQVTVHKLGAQEPGKSGIEICHVSATKQHGIFEVARLLHINSQEIIGVGDGYNDFPLLMACGLKIAMGNAVPELKAIADFVAPTVHEDGVAVVFERFINSLS